LSPFLLSAIPYSSDANHPLSASSITASLLCGCHRDSDDLSDSIPSLLHEAVHLFKTSQYIESAATFRRVYDRHPYLIDFVDIYSTVLWHLRDEGGLSELSRHCLEIAPSRSESWIASGNFASIQRNSDLAIQLFNRATKLNAGCAYGLSLAGSEYVLSESFDQATRCYREALAVDPREWTAWYGLGSILFRRDQVAAGEYYMKRAIELNPRSSVLHGLYGLALRKCGRDDEAMAQLDTAIDLDPRNLAAAYEKGHLLVLRGELDTAREILIRVQGCATREPGYAMLRAALAQRMGDEREVIHWFTEAVMFGQPLTSELITVMEGFVDKVADEALGRG
jgi:anaphase-promoting complex subunit 3